MTRTQIACVIVLLVLAGCGGSADPTSTATPAPIPDRSENVSLPPGVEEDTVNATVLANAHREAVQNRSYVLVVVDRRRVGGQELGARFAGTRQVVRVSRDRSLSEEAAVSARAAFSATVVERVSYSDGSDQFVREETGNGTSYRVTSADPSRYPALAADLVGWHLAVKNVSVVPRADGGAEIRGSSPTKLNATYYTVEASVGPDGFVRELRANYLDSEGTARWVTVRYRRVGNTTVDRPDWVDDAMANVTVTQTPTPAR